MKKVSLAEIRARYQEYQWCLYRDVRTSGSEAYAEALISEGSDEPTLLFTASGQVRTGTHADGYVRPSKFALPAFDSFISPHVKILGTFDPIEEFVLVGVV